MSTVYTQNQAVYLPEKKIEKPLPGYTYVPLRGYCACLAVFSKALNLWLGWIDTKTLGFETAKEWMVATDWKDEGL